MAAWYLIIASIGLMLWIGSRLSWLAGALFAWCMIEGVRFFAVPDELNPVFLIGRIEQARELTALAAAKVKWNLEFTESVIRGHVTTFEAVSAHGVAVLLAVAIPVMLLRSERKVAVALSWIGFLNSIAVIVSWAIGRGPYFALDNPSMDGTLIAMLYPVMNMRPTVRKWGGETLRELFGSKKAFLFDALSVAIPLTAIILTKSSMAWGTFAVVCAAYIYRLEKGEKNTVMFVAGMVFWGWLMMGHDFADPNGRFEWWRWAMKFWRENISHWAGTGTGSYWNIADKIGQSQYRFGKVIFNTMHNDWLQLCFEQGYVGLILGVGVFLKAAWSAWDEPWLFASVLGIGFLCCGQMFIHIPMPAFAIGWIIAQALRRNRGPAYN